jgi:hypothetical protein
MEIDKSAHPLTIACFARIGNHRQSLNSSLIISSARKWRTMMMSGLVRYTTRLEMSKCSCDINFCNRHWEKHISKHPTHKKAIPAHLKRVWGWVKGSVEYLTDNIARAAQFQKDKGAKWFGLVVERSGHDRIRTLVETPRFANLVEDSIFHSRNSSKRRYPSLVSFVGEYRAGKSTLSKLSPDVAPTDRRGNN